MNVFPDSLVPWIALALVLFWFVGAYNRLMRLRTAALQAYTTLDAALVRQLEFVLARTHADAVEGGADEAVPGLSSGTSLQAAAGQLATLLAATRLRPLAPPGIAALGTALHVLVSAWQRLHPDAVLSFDADGTLSRPAPLNGVAEPIPTVEGTTPIAWPEPSAAAEIARGQFNLAVLHYNDAIHQFPALLVAWIMQLRPAAPLR